jgi:ubiquinone/menaquinone biosynthesis C-methylase UbiE
MAQPYVCPSSFSYSLDNFIRRLVHKPEIILKPFIKEGMVVLDMGCGPGYFTKDIAGLVGDGGKVIAADLQQGMLDKMIKRVRDSGLEKRVEAHQCQPDSTGIRKKVDFILAFWMVHEVPDQQRFFKEMGSLLNPGGRIMVAEPKIHVTRKSFSEMVNVLESTGFKIIGRPEIVLSRSLLLARSA